MTPILQALPLDWSAKSPNNRTKGELHDISSQYGLPYRIIIMEKGYFYTDDLVLIDSRGYVLKPQLDYQCIAISKEVIEEVAKSACAVIMVTNPSVSDLIMIDAQMVGGRFCSVNPAIVEIAALAINGANRKLYWNNVTDKPNSYRPNGHLHALWELFGFTEQTGIIRRMTTAIDKTVAKEFDGLFDEFMIKFTNIRADLTTVEARLTTHINDTNLPHAETKVQLALDNVVNSAPATQTEAEYPSNTLQSTYTTVLRTNQSIAVNFTPLLTSHVNNTNNPHKDTAAKLGTMTNLQVRNLAANYYNKGETVNTTYRLAGLAFNEYKIQAQANIPINQIRSGVFPYNYYSGLPPSNSLLQPSSNGQLVWRNIPSIVNNYIKPGNNIVYAGTTEGIGANIPDNIVAWLNGKLGTNFAQNTIAIFRMSPTWITSTGHGVYYTYFTTVNMARFINGSWHV